MHKLPEGIKCVECPEPVEGLFWIYILWMRNGMFYVGQTQNVARRLQQHAKGNGSRQAKQLKEFFLVFVEGPMGFSAAINRERQLKKWSHAKKEALLKGDLERLKLLSKSRDC